MKPKESPVHHHSFLLLALTALGVVYGDIGTSPLYAVNEVFFGRGNVSVQPEYIFGAIGLIVWLLTIIVTCKYIIFVLRAEYEGNGGVFSLLGIVKHLNLKKHLWVIPVLVLSAGLLFGEGIITPAISVLSAVEGLKVATDFFDPYIIPITMAILTGLFVIQYKGTKKIGTVFGPVMVVWFSVLALLGISQVIQNPIILNAFNPIHIVRFVSDMSLLPIMFVFGSVLLAVTGVEALYADMGHFGVGPIRTSWFFIVYPALILNYLGQGAYLLSGAPVLQNNIFYSIVPSAYIYPMVILATFATIIASQALISGAYSLIAQAIPLNFSPRFVINHKNEHHEGQIYIPVINWLLYVGCMSLVVLFQSSTNLAAAYGLAVSGVMFVTSLTMIVIARYKWHWKPLKAVGVFGLFALIDVTFLLSNSVKFLEGGYIPLLIGLTFFVTMMTWNKTRKMIAGAYETFSSSKSMKWLVNIKTQLEKNDGKFDNGHGTCVMLDRAVIFLVSRMVRTEEDSVPTPIRVYLKRTGALPKYIIIMNILKEKHAYLSHGEKHDVIDFGSHVYSVQSRCGFMEQADIADLVEHLASRYSIPCNVNQVTVQVGDEVLIIDPAVSMIKRIFIRFYRILNHISITVHRYFGLSADFNLSTTLIPVFIKKDGAEVRVNEMEILK